MIPRWYFNLRKIYSGLLCLSTPNFEIQQKERTRKLVLPCAAMALKNKWLILIWHVLPHMPWTDERELVIESSHICLVYDFLKFSRSMLDKSKILNETYQFITRHAQTKAAERALPSIPLFSSTSLLWLIYQWDLRTRRASSSNNPNMSVWGQKFGQYWFGLSSFSIHPKIVITDRKDGQVIF